MTAKKLNIIGELINNSYARARSAFTARDVAGCVPEGTPPRDAYGLPMQIWS